MGCVQMLGTARPRFYFNGASQSSIPLPRILGKRKGRQVDKYNEGQGVATPAQFLVPALGRPLSLTTAGAKIRNHMNDTTEQNEQFLSVPYIRKTDITLRERMTLAAVLYRSRFQKGASIKWIADRLYFGRATVARHLKTLLEKGYVRNEGGRYLAVDHPKYVKKKNADEEGSLPKQLCYFHMKLYRCDHIVDRALLALGRTKLATRPQTKSGLAKMLGVSRAAIIDSLRTLDGLITVTNNTNGTFFFRTNG